MSAGNMPTSPTSISKCFTSTPVKYSKGNDLLKSLGDCVISDEEDTYSLLSPIYHDSFDSDEDLEDESLPTPALSTDTSLRHSEEPKPSSSPDRCELPKTRIEQPVAAAVESIASHTLSAWEMWLVNKAKDERMKLERKAEEERLLMEKKLQQERDQVQKNMMVEERIQEWLKMKREQERQQKMLKLTKEQEELRRQKAKQSETEQKAQTKYREWLRNKNQEKMEKEKREKEEAIRKQEQELERRRKAEESFQEWVAGATEKSRASPQSPCFPKSPYDKSYPSPSFFNPVPWKPIHTPLPETQLKNTSQNNPGRHPKHQQSSRDAVKRINNSAVAARLLQWR